MGGCSLIRWISLALWYLAGLSIDAYPHYHAHSFSLDCSNTLLPYSCKFDTPIRDRLTGRQCFDTQTFHLCHEMSFTPTRCEFLFVNYYYYYWTRLKACVWSRPLADLLKLQLFLITVTSRFSSRQKLCHKREIPLISLQNNKVFSDISDTSMIFSSEQWLIDGEQKRRNRLNKWT